MKMTQSDYNDLLSMIEANIKRKHLKNYINNLKKDTKINDVNKRFRWDIFWHCTESYFRDSLYKYLNDNHIDTALKRMVNDLHLPKVT